MKLRRIALLLVPAVLVLGGALGAASDAVVPIDGALDPAARLQDGGSAWEHWDLTVSLESGHRVFARFTITNAGPGSRNGVAIGHVVDPNGQTHRFKNGRTESGWTLSDDRSNLDMGKSHLHLRGPTARLWIEKKSVQLDLRFALGEGRPVPAELLPKHYAIDVLSRSTSIAGTLRLDEGDVLQVHGQAALVHTWAKRPEGEQLRRRIEFFSLDGERSLYFLVLQTARGADSHWAWLSPGQGSLISSSGEARATGSAPWQGESGYPVPGSVSLVDERVSLAVDLEKKLLSNNPMGLIPLPVRFFLSKGMDPLRVWAASRFHVTLSLGSGQTPLPSQGHGVTVVTFLNPISETD